MNALTIANTAIRQDADGRYCLNDLHRASGGESKNQPANWLRMQQTQELAAELDREGVPQIRGIESKQGLGTFVCKELVYAYAMWISPAFHLKVIRAYDSMVAKPSGLNAGNLTRLELLSLAMQAEQERMALESQVGELSPKAAALDRISTPTDGAVCLRVAAKLAQVPERQFIAFLSGERWIFRQRQSQTWAGYSDKEQAGLIELKRTTVTRDDGSAKTVEQVLITPRGQARITELIERKAPHLRKVPAEAEPA